MRREQFTSDAFGTPERRPGDKWAFWYYLPNPIPRVVPLSEETQLLLSRADAALGHLHGLGQLIKDPELLLGPYLTREALASSRIEGTEASLSDVLQAEASGSAPRNENVLEVESYIAATRYAVRAAQALPLSTRLVRDIHEVLMRGVRGQEKLPGEFRRSPVWVGGRNPESAVFVPPLPDHLPDLLSDWESYVNEAPVRAPTLIRCGLMHYQFETIHPFLDGNGRMGRLVIGLLLMQEHRLTTPLLYLSAYLETHRREYYDRLQAVRESGDIEGWLQFFLAAVAEQAQDGVQRAGRLVELREQYIKESAHARSRIGFVIDLMFSNPYLTVSRVEKASALTNQGARNLIHEAVARGWLHSVGSFGRGGKAYWVADAVLEIIEAPTVYNDQTEDTDASLF